MRDARTSARLRMFAIVLSSAAFLGSAVLIISGSRSLSAWFTLVGSASTLFAMSQLGKASRSAD